MSTHAADTAVRASLVVDAPIERAFSVFTEGIGSWWPSEYNILEVDIAERVFEPRVGGHVYARGVDGSECHWARVLAFEPPTRFVISWDLSPHWQVETDPERTSEVEVRFIAEQSDRTRVACSERDDSSPGAGIVGNWRPPSDGLEDAALAGGRPSLRARARHSVKESADSRRNGHGQEAHRRKSRQQKRLRQKRYRRRGRCGGPVGLHAFAERIVGHSGHRVELRSRYRSARFLMCGIARGRQSARPRRFRDRDRSELRRRR